MSTARTMPGALVDRDSLPKGANGRVACRLFEAERSIHRHHVNMNETVNRRLKHLEERVSGGWGTASEQVQQSALHAISAKGLDCLQALTQRGAPFSFCTPAENVTLQRFGVEYEVAPQRIGSRPRDATRGHRRRATGFQ